MSPNNSYCYVQCNWVTVCYHVSLSNIMYRDIRSLMSHFEKEKNNSKRRKEKKEKETKSLSCYNLIPFKCKVLVYIYGMSSNFSKHSCMSQCPHLLEDWLREQ